ncbi:MAG: FeoB-associated Cys-rich membrane protein [Clostridia bacterium]|nr:FeoB-associated Cys-rich membrane protein [Clostridia bacterium]
MGPVDIIVVLIIALIVGGATAYIIKAKKSGKKCIGCPDSSSCSSGKCSGSCGNCGSDCHCDETEQSNKN